MLEFDRGTIAWMILFIVGFVGATIFGIKTQGDARKAEIAARGLTSLPYDGCEVRELERGGKSCAFVVCVSHSFSVATTKLYCEVSR